MRQLAALLSMVIALSAGAAEMWRWKDADGVVHYSDRPVQGAERIDVRAQSTTGAPPAAPGGMYSTPRLASTESAATESAVARYTRCAVVSPANDQVFNSVSMVMVSLAAEPGLQAGHRVEVLLNGTLFPQWPPGTLSHALTNLYRGSYTLSMRVLDASGREQCSSPVVSFHVRLPSVSAPGRQQPGKKP